jgi:hypothetical protein
VKLHAAGNVEIPAYLTLVEKGYIVTCEWRSDTSDYWLADGPLGQFGAEDPISLLGVVAVVETRGDSWRATDDEIDAYLEKFVPPSDG